MKRIIATVCSVCLVISIGLFSTSCGPGGYNLEIPGINGPNVKMFEDNVMITAVFKNVQIDAGARFNIPKYPNSYIEISPDLESDGTLMVVSVSLQDIFHNDNVDSLDPMTLPGGRPLPGVAGGTLPAVAFTIEQFNNMAFYLGPKVFGIFAPLSGLDMAGGIITARFYTGSKRVGNISLVGEDEEGENGGFLLMLDMKKKTKKKLKKIAKKYD